MEDDRVSSKELLVARNNKKYRKICGKIQYVLEDEELNESISRKVEVE